MTKPGHIRFMTLPLFLNGWFVQYARRRFPVFGKKVVNAALFLAARSLALEMGAVIGRARPQLVDRTIRSQSDPGASIQRIKAIFRELLLDRIKQGPPNTFDDLVEQVSVLENMRDSADADEALGNLTTYTMQGFVTGSEHPELTVQLVERRLASKRKVAPLLKEAGLRLPPGPEFETYGDWERYLLTLVDTWEARWGSLAP